MFSPALAQDATEFVFIDPQNDLEVSGVCLGRGGFGRVLRAVYKRGGGSTGAHEHTPVAVKFLFVSAKLPEGLVTSFHAAALAQSTHAHANVARLHGACIRPPNLCLVQELAVCGRRVRAAGGRRRAKHPLCGRGRETAGAADRS